MLKVQAGSLRVSMIVSSLLLLASCSVQKRINKSAEKDVLVPSLASWCPPPTAPDGLLHTELEGEIIRKKTTSAPGNYMGYYDDVLKTLSGGATNPVPAGDAIKTMKIIEAASSSAETGKVITL